MEKAHSCLAVKQKLASNQLLKPLDGDPSCYGLRHPGSASSSSTRAIHAEVTMKSSWMQTRLIHLQLLEGLTEPSQPSCSRSSPRDLNISTAARDASGAEAAEPRGDFALHISLLFFSPPMLVRKLNACFEFLIRPSSFCHLFCFVMHYIQLHISNPQILPRHQNTCQAFTFCCRRIKGLLRLPHTIEQDALSKLGSSDPKPVPSTGLSL